MLRKRKTSALRSVGSVIQMLGKHKPQLDTCKYLIGFVEEDKARINLLEVEQSYPIYRHLANDKVGELVGLNTNAEGIEHREMIIQEIGTKKGKKILQ